MHTAPTPPLAWRILSRTQSVEMTTPSGLICMPIRAGAVVIRLR